MGGSATVEILWPDKDSPVSDDVTDNNRSLVSLAEFAGVRILLCSDIEEYAQRETLRLRPDLTADIVVIPHHGSTKTLDRAFLPNLNAKVLICSCDRTQYERIIGNAGSASGKPKRANTLYTAEDGAITVVVGSDGTIETAAFAK